MLVSEIVGRIQELYSKGVASDDSALSNRHIYNAMLTGRAVLISQEAKKGQRVNAWNYQTLPCVEMVMASPNECDLLPAKVQKAGKLMRTKYKIPKPLTNLSKHLFMPITSADGSIRFDETTFESRKYNAASRYTALKPMFFPRNEYLFFTGANIPEVIPITGLFEDPVEAMRFPSGCSQDVDCTSPMDLQFPLDMDATATLIEIVSKELLEMFLRNRQDKTNNSQDDKTGNE